MTEKRAENSVEIRACITYGSLLGLKSLGIHREVCDIYGEGQNYSQWSVCRWGAKFRAGQQDLKDAALLYQAVLQLLPQKVTLRKLLIYLTRMLDTP